MVSFWVLQALWQEIEGFIKRCNEEMINFEGMPKQGNRTLETPWQEIYGFMK